MQSNGKNKEHSWQRIQSILGSQLDIESATGLELMISLRRATVLSSALDEKSGGAEELSGPRWWLLLRLYVAEEMGSTDGLTPSHLSHTQQVSRNTISALLRGLEEQGYIQRITDPADLRIFRIRLSPAGRELILRTAPGRIRRLNRMYSALSPAEQADLLRLLQKVSQALIDRHCLDGQELAENPGAATGTTHRRLAW